MLAAAGEGYRSLLLVTSVSAEMASPERGEYCVSKAGLSMAAKLLALRLAPHGIGVFELRPGVVDTPMTAGVRDRWDARIAEGLVPMGRWGVPSDIAGVALACAQGHLAFATGAVLAVDGGLSIPRL
jgi:NAD(P)-dependent dehydrogenase (short-subunit alcohol dehydrogenase family)